MRATHDLPILWSVLCNYHYFAGGVPLQPLKRKRKKNNCSVLHIENPKKGAKLSVKTNLVCTSGCICISKVKSFIPPEIFNAMHFSHLADGPLSAVARSSFVSEWLPKFHTRPLNHIFSGLELTSLISWKSAIFDIISLSSWSPPRKAQPGCLGERTPAVRSKVLVYRVKAVVQLWIQHFSHL